jgi:hypothetical protein
MLRKRLWLAVGFVVLGTAAPVSAQSGGSSGVQTITPTRTGGTASQAGTTIGAASGATGSTFGASPTGAAAAGRQTGAATGGLSQPQFIQFGQAAQTVGTGFVGRGANQQGFIGVQAAGQQTVDAGGVPRFSGLGGQNGIGLVPAASQARGVQMRVQQRIAFPVTPVSPSEVAGNVQTTLRNLTTSLPGVSVTGVQPGHVRLQGEVDSEHARRLAEALARLEPGVRRVTNELEVNSASP